MDTMQTLGHMTQTGLALQGKTDCTPGEAPELKSYVKRVVEQPATSDIESNPSFKKLKAQVDSIQLGLESTQEEVRGIKSTLQSTGDDVKDIKNMLRNMATPCRAAPSGTASDGCKPMFMVLVTLQTHEKALDTLAVSHERRDMRMLASELAEQEGVPYLEWWQAVAKTKTLNMWKARLVALGAPEVEVDTLNLAKVAQYLYSYLDVAALIGGKLQEPLL